MSAIIGEYGVIISASVAIFAMFYNNYRSRILSRKQFTIAILLKGLENADLRESLDTIFELADMRRGGAQVSRSLIKGNEKYFRAVRHSLNYYEFICAAYHAGDIDGKMLMETRGNRIKRAFDTFSDYINETRSALGNDNLYSNVERFASGKKRK